MADNKARSVILKVASELFYKHGIRAIGVDRIIAESGVAKATFYRHFPSKNDLIAATLEARDLPVRKKLMAESERRASRDHISVGVALFDTLGDWFASASFHGCAFARATLEMQEDRIREIAKAHKASLQSWLADALTREGAPDAKLRAHALMLLLDGAMVRTLIDREASSISAARAAASTILGDRS